ncbi:MAG: hypothetical protein K2M20_06090 [Lachnospiraceae bacterium]|nr:hypothetical protein [Lachnospiraceae bacterium]
MNRVTDYGRRDGSSKGTGVGNGRNRRNRHAGKGIAAALLALTLGLCAAAPAVRAEEPQKEAAGQSAAWTGLSSRGSLVYQAGKRDAAVYAADLLLLHEKIAAIPEEGFDPVRYTHTHQWEYRDVNEKTHTRHCGLCGDAFDLVCAHSVSHEEDGILHHEGAAYPGRRYRCVCGWQWEREATHVVVFETVDQVNHQSRCLLEDTAFCRGYEPLTEEHYAYRYDPCEDGTHHTKSCIDCGFEAETEECGFTLEAKPEDGDDRDTNLLYCVCGNGQAAETEEEQTGTDASGDGEQEGQDITGEEAPDEPETPEETDGEEPDEPETSEETDGEEPEDETLGEPPEEPGGASEAPLEEPGGEQRETVGVEADITAARFHHGAKEIFIETNRLSADKK